MLSKFLLILFILAGQCALFAQSAADHHELQSRRLWMASVIAVAAASGMDAETSWGKRETNGLLASTNGTFGIRGVSIKAGLIGATLLPQILYRNHVTWRHRFMLANWVEAGAFSAVSVHNARIR